ncbi:MAG: radical SAM protein, partial [Verrucomicrobiota bacterium]
RNDLLEVLSDATEKGLRPTLATNGLLFNRISLTDLKSSIGIAQVSLDTLDDEKYRDLRGYRGKEPVKVVIDGLSNLGDASITRRVVTVLSKDNENELEPLAERLASIGIEQWFIFLVQPTGRAAGDAFDEFEIHPSESIRNRLETLTRRYEDMTISFWGSEESDKISIGVSSSGFLKVLNYGTSFSEQLLYLPDSTLEDLQSCWDRVPSSSKHSCVVNFTTPSRNAGFPSAGV